MLCKKVSYCAYVHIFFAVAATGDGNDNVRWRPVSKQDWHTNDVIIHGGGFIVVKGRLITPWSIECNLVISGTCFPTFAMWQLCCSRDATACYIFFCGVVDSISAFSTLLLYMVCNAHRVIDKFIELHDKKYMPDKYVQIDDATNRILEWNFIQTDKD